MKIRKLLCIMTMCISVLLSACNGQSANNNQKKEVNGEAVEVQEEFGVDEQSDNQQREETNEVKADQSEWDVESYKNGKDILSIRKVDIEETNNVSTYSIRYKSDDCEVVSYLSVPNSCINEQKPYPCIIFNRGGNRDYGANKAEDIAYLSESSGKIVFASQYRGVSGGTGEDQFGGGDLQDVIKLIDLCEEFAFVDMEHLYMLGTSRGGMMTYMAIRQDERIKKAVVVSGVADMFMSYEADEAARTEVYEPLIGGTPETVPEEYEKRSATSFAGELKCPVLIIHSKKDERVSFAQAEKMVSCLEAAGKEYQFVTYEDNTHGMHAEDFQIIMDWFQ